MSSLSALIAVRATVTSNHQLEKLIIWDQSQFWAQIIEIESGFTHPWIKSPHTTRTTGQDRGHLNKFLALACNDVRGAGGDIPVLLTVGELERYLG